VILSIRETKMCPKEDKHNISHRMHEMWFADASMHSTLRAVFCDVSHAVYTLGCRLDDLVRAYGAHLCEARYAICKRLGLLLQ